MVWMRFVCYVLIVITGFVYDVTDFLDQHPGSAYVDYLGMDISYVFKSPYSHVHSEDACATLELYKIGTLKEE